MTEPLWLTTVRREATIRRSLILYGNTRDIHPSSNGYASLPVLLARELGPQFDLVARWDASEGFSFGSEDHARRFTRALAPAAVSGERYDLGSGPAEPAAYRSPVEMAGAIELLLNTSSVRPLVIIDFAHLLVSSPSQLTDTEREMFLRLGRAIRGPHELRLTEPEVDRATGCVVLLTAKLGALPTSLYQSEARVRSVPVPPPSRVERREFFARHIDDVRVIAPPPGPARTIPDSERTTEALAELSEGLSVVDLKQVVALSRRDAPTSPESLLNLYRLGERRSPWQELSRERLEGVRERLAERVKGQEAAVDDVATMLLRAYLGFSGLQHSGRSSKPKGVLFFVGPTGVGKTELAKATAQFLFGDEQSCVRFDMSEFNHEHSDQRLVGAPPGYVGFEDGGQLTNAVTARPFSVLLFDEIEKAHPRVLDKFLQILEDGRLTDGKGETAWFSEAVLIFTSNIGAASMPSGANVATNRAHFESAVGAHFQQIGRPELRNRLGENVVVFGSIQDEKTRRAIVERKLEPVRAHLQRKWGVGLELSSAMRDHVVGTARLEHGGRGLINAIEAEIINPLARVLFEREHQLAQGRRVVVDWVDEVVDIQVTQ